MEYQRTEQVAYMGISVIGLSLLDSDSKYLRYSMVFDSNTDHNRSKSRRSII